MDYTFENYEEDQEQGVANVKKLLTDNGLEQDFSDLFEVRVGHLIPGAMVITMYLICHPL